MEQLILKASHRKLKGKKVKNLRREGQIPAILYGKNFISLPLTLSQKEFIEVGSEAGEATIINLDIAGKEKEKVLIRYIQRDPVTDDLVHVDFYKVDMKQEIQTEIPLEFTGTAPAVEELEGNLITNKDSVKVECLPDKLVSKIEVEIAVLKTFDDLIHVSDLKIPEAIKVLDEPEDVVAQVTPPRSEEELQALETEATAETEKTQIETMEAQATAEKATKETEPEQPAAEPKKQPK